MRIAVTTALAVVAVAGTLAMSGCGQKPESQATHRPGVGERAGIAADKAAERTVDAARTTAAATKDAADVAVDKAGAALEKAGAAVEQTGADMQK